MSKKRLYAHIPLWRRYAELLPEGYGIGPGLEPAEEYWRWNGMDIHVDRYRNADAPAKIILLHGVGGNGRVLSFIGVPLAARGFETAAPDLPGYGLTDTKGVPYDYETWIRMAVDFVDHESSRDGRPIILFGLSAGGMLSYRAACRNSKVRGIAAGCILDFREPEVLESSAVTPAAARIGLPLLRLLAKILPGLKIPMKAVAKMEALVNDEELLRLLMSDTTSAGSRLPVVFITSMISSHPEIEPEDFAAKPFLLVHPAEDKWVDVRLSRLFFDRLACPKRLVILPEAGHFPCEMPGLRIMKDTVIEFFSEVAEEAPARP